MTLDDKRDHDVQSWLMGQAGEFVLKRRKGTSDSLEAQVKLLLRRWAFLLDIREVPVRSTGTDLLWLIQISENAFNSLRILMIIYLFHVKICIS